MVFFFFFYALGMGMGYDEDVEWGCVCVCLVMRFFCVIDSTERGRGDDGIRLQMRMLKKKS